MKELQDKITDPIAEVRQTKLPKQETLLGRVRLRPGMFWWELDTRTMLLHKATLENERVEMVPLLSIFTRKKIGVSYIKVADLKRNEDCLYDVAINWRNAKRKFLKRIYEKSKIVSGE